MAYIEASDDEIIFEADVKFTGENSGFKLCSADGREGGQIARQGDKIGNIGAKDVFNEIAEGNAESWYHITVNARSGGSYYGKAGIYEYDDNGNMTVLAENAALDMRSLLTNKSDFNHIEVLKDTYIDNIRVIKPAPDSLNLSLTADAIAAGEAVRAECKVLRKGKEMEAFSASRLTWAIYDENNLAPIDDALVTVNSSGTVTADAAAGGRTVYVRVSSDDNGAYDAKPLKISPKEIFTVTGVRLGADNGTIEGIKVIKNFAYSGNVTFITAVYDENGTLIRVRTKNIRSDTLQTGENEIDIDSLELPENYNQTRVMALTSL